MQKTLQEKNNEQIALLQEKLVPLVNDLYLQKEINFTSDFYKESVEGNYWTSKEKIPGQFLLEKYENDLEKYLEISKEISEGYQKVIEKYFEQEGLRQIILEDGKKKVFGKLFMWSGPIIEAGLITHEEIVNIAAEFEKTIVKGGENFFGYFHGNIIGDHIYIGDDNKAYLFGMRITLQPGKGYYDYLRALDWLFLKSETTEESFTQLVERLKSLADKFDWDEIKLVFALRCIGILGWDMLHRGDYGKGDAEKKIELLLKFIRRQY